MEGSSVTSSALGNSGGAKATEQRCALHHGAPLGHLPKGQHCGCRPLAGLCAEAAYGEMHPKTGAACGWTRAAGRQTARCQLEP